MGVGIREAGMVLLRRPAWGLWRSLRYEQAVVAEAEMCQIGVGSTKNAKVHAGCVKYEGPV